MNPYPNSLYLNYIHNKSKVLIKYKVGLRNKSIHFYTYSRELDEMIDILATHTQFCRNSQLNKN
jgi:hypothetical protein